MNRNQARFFSPPSRFFIGMVLLGTVVTAGCSNSGQPYVSAARLQALEHNSRGVEAESRGNHELARSQFAQSLQLSSSIDDADGAVVALLNLCRLARRSSALPVAENYMQRALNRVREVPSRESDVAVEKTLLLLAQGEPDTARIWAQRAVEHSGSGTRAASFNLLARVDRLLGDPAGAETNARHALGALTGPGDRIEAANANRLLGELAMQSGRNGEATVFFQEALIQDKEAGLSPRIADDLRFLARLANVAGDSTGEIKYLHRAFEASLNGGDTKAALDDLRLLADVCRKSGDTVQAELFESLRLELSDADSGMVLP